MKTKKFSKSSKIVAIVLAGLMILGCSFAYFTDYATTNATGTAGTVAVSLDSGINLLDAEGRDILNPGDLRDAGFTVTNEGNKSIDVRTTLALTALDRDGNAINFTGDAESQSEFDLYLRSDVEEVTGEGYKPLADAKPLAVKSINGNVITYAIADYSLNGNSDEYAEVETIDGVNAFAKTSDYVLVFKGETGNDWQAATITMDVLVEAKQHENTGAGWDIVAQESVTTGSITKDAVKAENVITTDAPAGTGDGMCDTCGMDMSWHPGDPANHGCDNLVWEEGCGDGATYGMCANCTSMIPCQNGVDVQ